MSSLCSVLGQRVRVRVRVLWRASSILALLALVALALGGAIDPLQSGALTMLPALALAAMMLTRPYVGERAIARLRARRPSRRRAIAIAMTSVRPRPCASVARGGRLIAAALAGRAPPLALAGHS
jgi:hypothetical protein